MQTQKRRLALEQMLAESEEPITAAVLAERFGVSRQVIVGDIALLRAGGTSIAATPRGYRMERPQTGKRYTVACQHSAADVKDELYTIVDLGGHVLDVIVAHPIYGEIIGELHLLSRFDVDRFCDLLKEAQAPPLSMLTGGIHLHTVACNDEAMHQRILSALDQKGFLVK